MTGIERKNGEDSYIGNDAGPRQVGIQNRRPESINQMWTNVDTLHKKGVTDDHR